MANSPCYKCEERTSICHAHCERYIAYYNERRKMNEERHKEIYMSDYIFDTKRKRRIKRKAGEL